MQTAIVKAVFFILLSFFSFLVDSYLDHMKHQTLVYLIFYLLDSYPHKQIKYEVIFATCGYHNLFCFSFVSLCCLCWCFDVIVFDILDNFTGCLGVFSHTWQKPGKSIVKTSETNINLEWLKMERRGKSFKHKMP